MEILAKNETDLSCHIWTNFKDFNLLVDYQTSSRHIELPKHTSATLTLLPKGKPTELNAMNFLIESGRILKKREFSFPVMFHMKSGTCVPVLSGKTKKNVAKLIGRNGFFVRKYMNDRHDTYILEICKEAPHGSKGDSGLSTLINDATPLLSKNAQK